MLIDFDERNGLIASAQFRQVNLIFYIWKTPASGDRNRHHLDYTLINFQCRNRIQNVQKNLGAEIDSKHSLIVAETFSRLKKSIRFLKRKPTWHLQKLYSTAKSASRFRRITLGNRLRKWKSGITWKHYQELCLSDYE